MEGASQTTYTSQMQQPKMSAPVPIHSQPMSMTMTMENSMDGESKPKRVYKIKHHFEKNTETVNQNQSAVPPLIPAPELPQLASSLHTQSHTRQVTHEPAPPPPAQFTDAPRMAPAPPPPPPPPPPVKDLSDHNVFDKDKGTFTFRDRKGRARTVRIGRVVWPPPVAKEEKKARDVGKLEIDESVQQEIVDAIKPLNQIKKPDTPRQEIKVRIQPYYLKFTQDKIASKSCHVLRRVFTLPSSFS